MKSEIALVTGRANRPLAEKIAAHLGLNLLNEEIVQFKDGEIQAYYNETIRGRHVFIIQPTFSPAENILELLILIDAAKRASAAEIIAVVPYFGYSRQDRKDRPRTSIGSKLMANLLTAAGINRLITMDLHADQIQGFFEVPVDHLFASSVFLPYIRSLNWDNLCIVSPDTGGTKRASVFAKVLNCDFAIGFKQRVKANEVSNLQIIGNVEGKNVILLDDIIDTGGTICKAAARVKECGAKQVYVMCTHALLSGNALEKLEESVVDKFIITDTIPMKRPSEKFVVLTVANLIGDVIQSVIDKTSIASHFEVGNV